MCIGTDVKRGRLMKALHFGVSKFKSRPGQCAMSLNMTLILHFYDIRRNLPQFSATWTL